MLLEGVVETSEPRILTTVSVTEAAPNDAADPHAPTAGELVFVFGCCSSGKSTYIEREIGVEKHLWELAAYSSIKFINCEAKQKCSKKFDKWIKNYHRESKSTSADLHLNLFHLFQKGKDTESTHRQLRTIVVVLTLSVPCGRPQRPHLPNRATQANRKWERSIPGLQNCG